MIVRSQSQFALSCVKFILGPHFPEQKNPNFAGPYSGKVRVTPPPPMLNSWVLQKPIINSYKNLRMHLIWSARTVNIESISKLYLPIALRFCMSYQCVNFVFVLHKQWMNPHSAKMTKLWTRTVLGPRIPCFWSLKGALTLHTPSYLYKGGHEGVP